MQITKHKVASIDYTLTNNAGQQLDTSKGGQPLTYLHGVGGLIPGLEAALEGKTKGENLKVTIAPEQAYGRRNEQLVGEVPRKAFQGVNEVKPGMQFRAETPQGMQVVNVVAVEGDVVRIDGNHPLAGETLNFEVDVVDVRDATAEEISHGHAHGPGDGHHHH